MALAARDSRYTGPYTTGDTASENPSDNTRGTATHRLASVVEIDENDDGAHGSTTDGSELLSDGMSGPSEGTVYPDPTEGLSHSRALTQRSVDLTAVATEILRRTVPYYSKECVKQVEQTAIDPRLLDANAAQASEPNVANAVVVNGRHAGEHHADPASLDQTNPYGPSSNTALDGVQSRASRTVHFATLPNDEEEDVDVLQHYVLSNTAVYPPLDDAIHGIQQSVAHRPSVATRLSTSTANNNSTSLAVGTAARTTSAHEAGASHRAVVPEATAAATAVAVVAAGVPPVAPRLRAQQTGSTDLIPEFPMSLSVVNRAERGQENEDDNAWPPLTLKMYLRRQQMAARRTALDAVRAARAQAQQDNLARDRDALVSQTGQVNQGHVNQTGYGGNCTHVSGYTPGRVNIDGYANFNVYANANTNATATGTGYYNAFGAAQHSGHPGSCIPGYSGYNATAAIGNASQRWDSESRAGQVYNTTAAADDDYRIQLPPIQLQAPPDLAAGPTSMGAIGAQDLSAVPPSMRVSFNTLTAYEHGDFAQMRAQEHWPAATAATTMTTTATATSAQTQVQTSEFPAARYYERPLAFSRPDQVMMPEFQVPGHMQQHMYLPMPLRNSQQTSQQTSQHIQHHLPCYVPHQAPLQIPQISQAYDPNRIDVSPHRDNRDTTSNLVRQPLSFAEPGLRDYNTVIQEMETRDRARRGVVQVQDPGYAGYLQAVARLQAAEDHRNNQRTIASQSLERQRVQVHSARDDGIPDFGGEDFYDGYTASATTLPTARQLAVTQTRSNITPSIPPGFENHFNQRVATPQGQAVSDEVSQRDTQTAAASFVVNNPSNNNNTALASGQQNAVVSRVQGSRNVDSTATGSHVASSNVIIRRTSVSGNPRPAYALDLSARGARENSMARGQATS
ncbi:hypothetical protein SBRCBS47491_006309 [Sporothrix bragantina]|uniref:Uncharacterized protein n=1 Tax=Sporothrix bragantina TaxID=671064 RepID=A0ABP0C3X1_9PEZI